MNRSYTLTNRNQKLFVPTNLRKFLKLVQNITFNIKFTKKKKTVNFQNIEKMPVIALQRNFQS